MVVLSVGSDPVRNVLPVTLECKDALMLLAYVGGCWCYLFVHAAIFIYIILLFRNAHLCPK